MQENGRMNWLEQIRQMKNRDIRTIEQHELQELSQDAVEHGLPQEEKLKNLLDKVRNPYCYLDNGIIVKLNFAPRKCGAFRFSDEQYCRFVKEVEGFCYTLI